MLPNANELIEELEDMGITVNINIPALEKSFHKVNTII